MLKTVLYEGNGGSQYISNVGFQPDFVWIKVELQMLILITFYKIQLEVQTSALISDSNGVEGTNPTFGSFDANGFSLTTSNVTWNGSGSDYVAWCWKGSNADAVSNTVGDITSQVNRF